MSGNVSHGRLATATDNWKQSDSTDIVILTGERVNSRGIKLFCRYWRPKDLRDMRGIVFICHGFGEHLGWYDELARKLTATGFLVFGHDHAGHGRSSGSRVYVEDVDDYVSDVLQHTADVKANNKGIPTFIYGHSMGGMVAVRTVMKNQAFYKGMILEGPLILPDPHEVTPTRLLLGKLFCNILPEIQLGKIKVEQVTRDPDVQQKFNNDKLRWSGGVKLITGMAFLRCLEDMHSKLSSVSLPLLILHGENDSLCQPAGSSLLYQAASSVDKQLKMFPGASHHLILDIEEVRDEVMQDVVDWMVLHTRKSNVSLQEENNFNRKITSI